MKNFLLCFSSPQFVEIILEHILTLKPSGIRRQVVIHAKTGSWLACTTAHRPHDGFPAAWMSLGNLRVVTPSLTRGCMWQGSTTAAAPGRIQRGCVGFTARTAFQAQSWDTAAPVTHTASCAVSEGSREPDSQAAGLLLPAQVLQGLGKGT